MAAEETQGGTADGDRRGRGRLRQPIRFPLMLLAALLVAGALMGAQWLGFSLGDDATADLRTRYLSEKPKSQHPGIAVILIDDATLATYPYRAPIDRDLVARLVRLADEAGAGAIGVDIVFDQRTEPAKDQAFVAAARSARPPVVLRVADHREQLSAERQAFQRDFLGQTGRSVGSLFFVTKAEIYGFGSERTIRFLETASKPAPGQPARKSFARLLAEAKAGPIDINVIPFIDFLLQTQDGTDPIMWVSASRLLASGGAGEQRIAQALKAQLKDRLVLIGGDLYDRDQHQTALSARATATTPGVLIHAHIVAQLLDRRIIDVLKPLQEFVLLFVAAAIAYIIGVRYRLRRWQFIVQGFGWAAFIALSCVAFVVLKLMVPVTAPLYAWIAGLAIGSNINLVHRWFRRNQLALDPQEAPQGS